MHDGFHAMFKNANHPAIVLAASTEQYQELCWNSDVIRNAYDFCGFTSTLARIVGLEFSFLRHRASFVGECGARRLKQKYMEFTKGLFLTVFNLTEDESGVPFSLMTTAALDFYGLKDPS